MANPNSEQILAIEHHGGVLLKAGAGSGKTFVLKEHLIYLTKYWIKEFKESNQLDFKTFIKSKYRSIVMMTFTKKAAAELEIRLNVEFQEKLDEAIEANVDSEYWQDAFGALQYLTVGTIHSFCFKLIKQGFFPKLSAEQDIITDTDLLTVIEELFKKWIDGQFKSDNEVHKQIVKDYGKTLDAIVEIFSDPTIRLSWKNSDVIEFREKELDEITENILSNLNVNTFFETSDSAEDYQEFEKKTWHMFLVSFEKAGLAKEKTFRAIIDAYEFFKSIDFKMPNTPSVKTHPEELVTYYSSIKEYKDFLKKYGEDFYLFEQEFETYIKPWFESVLSIFNYIDEEYEKVQGMTFSDLEYMVHQGLENQDVIEEISEQYKYFIVDEFQDTSFIQFAIIEKLIKKDFSKLFCVGDLKQAIYGFRGGELGVFLNCEKKIKQNLSLKNNYRSAKNVIEYNNLFFKEMFQLGIGFQGIDNHTVEVEAQAVPETQTTDGLILQLDIEASENEDEDKLSNSHVDYLEALALFEQIKHYYDQGERSCILYKRLKPSLILIDLLIQNNLGFTSQVKVPFFEDPLFGIFYSLTEFSLNKKDNSLDASLYTIQGYLSLLSGKAAKRISSNAINDYIKNVELFGKYNAFLDFLMLLGLKNSNYQNNLLKIKSIIEESQHDDEKLYKNIRKLRDFSYSLDFQYGNRSGEIIIMTAHASKGLQFPNVFLGGIYSNENIPGGKGIIGKIPYSFKWSNDLNEKHKFKTPYYIYENELVKQKDFSETKRLFYVANTRAEKTLNFVNIDFGDNKRTKNQKSSWANGIIECTNVEIEKIVSHKKIDISKGYSSEFLYSLDFRTPIFHKSNLGIHFTPEIENTYYLPELSVTKLSTLADCPKKFYLKNIVKLDEKDLDILFKSHIETSDTPENFFDESLPLSSANISSSSRGSTIHEKISEYIIHGELTNFESLAARDKKSIEWAVEKTTKYVDNFKLFSESPIKFELYGYMISGIPDLCLYPETADDLPEIWDFKTGRLNESKLENYKFQLYTYAYANYHLKKVDLSKKIKLVILFVDEKKEVEYNISFSDVDKYLTDKLKYLKQYDYENTSHCSDCLYQDICQK